MGPCTAQGQEPQPQYFRAKLFLLPTSLSVCLAWFCHQCELARGTGFIVCHSRFLSLWRSHYHSSLPSSRLTVFVQAHQHLCFALGNEQSSERWAKLCMVTQREPEASSQDRSQEGREGGRPFVPSRRIGLIIQHCLHLGNVKRGKEKVALEWGWT